MSKSPGRVALTVLAVALVLTGAALAVAFLPGFAQSRRLLDHLAADGSLDSFSAGLHARLRPLGGLGALLLLAGVAMLFFRARLLAVLGPRWAGLVERWRADARRLRFPRIERGDLLWLLLLMLAGGLANGLYLDQPMSHDEAYTVTVFASRTLLAAVSDYHLPNNHILHTVLVHVCMRLLGDAPWSVRLPAFLAFVALIPAGYLAARSLFDRRAGLLTAALIAELPVFRLYAANARGYTLVALFSLLALALAARIKKSDNRPAWLLLAAVFALGFWTQPVMLFPFGMIMTWLFLSWLVRDIAGADRRAFLRHWLMCGLTAALLTLILYTPVLIYSGLGAVFNPYVAPEEWDALFVNLFARLGVTLEEWSLGVPVILAAGLAAAALGALAFHRRLSDDRVPFLLAGAAWLLLQATVERVAPQPRFWFFLLPFSLIYVAAGLAALIELLARQRAPVLNGVAVALIAALGLYAAFSQAIAHPPSAPGTSERLIAFLLDGTLQPGDKVVSDYADAPSLWYYAGRAGLDPRILTHAAEDPFDRALVLVNESLGQTLPSVLRNQAVESRVDPSTAVLIGQVDRILIYALSPRTP